MRHRSSATRLERPVTAVSPAVTRQRSRTAAPTSPPPPLPLISLPPDDDTWDEFDTPTCTGFDYALPHIELANEEFEDASASSGADPERLKTCRLLSEYMTQNENFQTPRHGFGIDTRLVCKRSKDAVSAAAAGAAARSNTSSSHADTEDLSFDALFESGNLDRAYRVHGRHYASSHELQNTAATTSGGSQQPPFAFFVKADMEFDLYCDADVHTHGHIQWYFFRATLSTAPTALWRQQSQQPSSATTCVSVRFNIRNMLKRASLYNDGMLPAVYVESPSTCRRGWHHAGTNVCYFRNADTYRSHKTGKVQHYYTLSFVYEFDVASLAGSMGDPLPLSTPLRRASSSATLSPSPPIVVYFAHCYPYTYTRLQRFLLTLQRDPDRRCVLKRRVLCKTIAGNNCDVLTITDFSLEDTHDQLYATKRTGVVLTARVHPGESNSSWIVHGILDFLTGNSLEARFLRHHFVFKVVPMLNPDGVVHGNYRCSLAGTDLNRRWAAPSAELHPTIFATKAAILSMTTTRPVSLYVDIHGHSRKHNMFLYGCRPFTPASRTDAARLRLFPHLLDKISAATRGGFFSFADCTFSVSSDKKGTGRVVVWQEAAVLHSFTLEASFFGAGMNKQHTARGSSVGTTTTTSTSCRHYMPIDLRMAGTKFCHALLPFAQVINLDRVAAQAQHIANLRVEASLRAAAAAAQAAASSTTPSTSEYDAASTALAGPANSLYTSDNKLRLAPLAVAAMPVNDDSSDGSDPLPAFSDLPSEFDALFADDSLTALLALSDPEDLLKEIEAALSDMVTDDANDDGSVGSESDPSGDNMEDEELRNATAWATLLAASTASAAITGEPTRKLPREHPLRTMRHLSEPRLYQLVTSQRKSLQSTPTSTHAEPAVDPVPRTPAISAPLAPLRTSTKAPLQCIASRQRVPSDRNRAIASLHLRVVQRRSKSRREDQQPIHKANE